jgi:tetratricopeptide (TPR) repeat protein
MYSYEAQGDDVTALKWHEQDEKLARTALKELSAGDSPDCRAELLLERALVLVNIGVCLRRLDQFEAALSKVSKAYGLIMAHINSSSSATNNSSSNSSDPVLLARAVKERERAALELGNLWFERATDLRLANSSSSSCSSNSSSAAKAKNSADFAEALQKALEHYSESLQLCVDAHDAAKTAASSGTATSAAAVAAQLHPSALLRAQYNTGMTLCLGTRWSEAAAALRACTDEHVRLSCMAAAATTAAAAGAAVQLPAGVSARQLRAEVQHYIGRL